MEGKHQEGGRTGDTYGKRVGCVRDFMIEAGQCYLKDVPILVDVSVVDNWYEK